VSHDSSPDLSRIYRAGAHEEPPAWIDAKLRAAAADACHGSRAAGKMGFLGRWRVPLAVAAVITLSTSTVLLVQYESTHPSSQLSAVESKPTVEIVTERPPAAEHHAVPGSPRVVPPNALPSRLPSPLPEGDRSEQRLDSTVSPKRASADEAPANQMERRHRPDEQAAEKVVASSPPAKAESSMAPAAAAPEPRLSEGVHSLAKGNAVRSGESAARPRAKEDSVPRRDVDRSSGVPLEDPVRWLDQIERLYSEGREREARESLEQFRQSYPAYPIPDKFR